MNKDYLVLAVVIIGAIGYLTSFSLGPPLYEKEVAPPTGAGGYGGGYGEDAGGYGADAGGYGAPAAGGYGADAGGYGGGLGYL